MGERIEKYSPEKDNLDDSYRKRLPSPSFRFRVCLKIESNHRAITR